MIPGLDGLAIAMLIATVPCVVAGVVVHRWWLGRSAARSLRVPARWPLQARAVANAEERRVWRWLHQVFDDHQILLKTPVTCFTRAPSREGGLRWHPLLRGMYCTFTVCTADGHVLGCIDVLQDDQGLPRSQRQFRRALLSRCSIAYTVVVAERLPTAEEIRLELLGDEGPTLGPSSERHAGISAARWKLQAAINSRRHMLRGDPRPLSVDGANEIFYASEEGQPENAFYAGTWQQYDSFIAPLDGQSKLSGGAEGARDDMPPCAAKGV